MMLADLWEHVRLSHRLPDLLEPELEPALCGRLAEHVSNCPRCAARLDRLERADSLLGRLPAGLFPLEPALADRGAGRLSTLAQWVEAPARRSPYGALPAVSAMATAVLVLALSVTAPDWGAVVAPDLSGSTTVASVMPDTSFYPMTLR